VSLDQIIKLVPGCYEALQLNGSTKITGEYTNAIRENKNGLLDANKKVSLHVNAEKTRCNIHGSSPEFRTKP
jgi:hypothetical protein